MNVPDSTVFSLVFFFSTKRNELPVLVIALAFIHSLILYRGRMRKKQTAKQRKTEETTVVQEFVVEKIIRRRISNGRVEYFLKWKGFTE